jgi:A/G-specific adenine glycosylase
MPQAKAPRQTRVAATPAPPHPGPNPARIAPALLAWYDRHARTLPWRAPPGTPPTEPYRVWLSEIMLQQTRVEAVRPYFQRFLERWPTVQSLAAAELDQVLTEWAGLGYYARARSLHRCAAEVAGRHGGDFPKNLEGLLELPGIGPYTAAAIGAIAYDLPATVVDGNVERVVSRLFAIETPMPAAKPALRDAAATLTPKQRAGDFAQATMDLGATICTPTSPACTLCPLRAECRARAMGIQAELPRRAAKKQKPLRRGFAYWLVRGDGAVLLRRRPESGLLGGMVEVPSSEWREGDFPLDGAAAPAAEVAWQRLPGLVRHGFTHFDLELVVFVARGSTGEGLWVTPDRFGEVALPTVMRKIVRHAMGHTLTPTPLPQGEGHSAVSAMDTRRD